MAIIDSPGYCIDIWFIGQRGPAGWHKYFTYVLPSTYHAYKTPLAKVVKLRIKIPKDRNYYFK